MAYSNENEPIDDPTVGELIFKHNKWGRNPDNTTFAVRERLKSHRCTREELGLDQVGAGETTMYPIWAKYEKDFNYYHKMFLCPDKEDLRIFGDYNTQTA